MCQRVAVIYHKQFVCKLENKNVKIEIMNNPALWNDYPITNEIIVKTDKMYQLPQTKWSLKKKKIIRTINYLKRPFVKITIWINKKMENIRSRLG